MLHRALQAYIAGQSNHHSGSFPSLHLLIKTRAPCFQTNLVRNQKLKTHGKAMRQVMYNIDGSSMYSMSGSETDAPLNGRSTTDSGLCSSATSFVEIVAVGLGAGLGVGAGAGVGLCAAFGSGVGSALGAG